MAGRLQGKVAIVTGSARGIGAAIAALFAEHGAHVIGLDRQHAEADRSDIAHLTVDVTCPEEVVAAVTTTLGRFGRIDVLINNAGVNVFSEPLRLPDSEWERCFAIDLKAAWSVAKAVLPTMLSQGSGAIVNIASVHGHKIIPGCFPYPVAKHAVLGLTRALAIEYAARGIRVNAIAPGYIETPIAINYWNTFPDPEAEKQRAYDLHPPKRVGRPEEVAWTAVFLASDEAPFINAEAIVIDGGRSVLYHD